MSTEITEVSADKAFNAVEIDRDNAVIKNTTLLSPVSRNGRIYSEKSIGDATRLYEGARYYVDHPTNSEIKDRDGVRSVRDLAGKIVNVRTEGVYPDVKVRGDIHLLKATSFTESILSIAEQMPDIAGNSHRVLASLSKDKSTGRERVEGIDAVLGMELVTDPATTRGLFESTTTSTYETEDDNMTLAELKEKHPEVYQAAFAEGKAEVQAELDTVKADLQKIDGEKVALESKVQAFEDKEKETEREKTIAEKIKKAGLPAHAVTETFKKMLAEADDDQIDALIEDRKAVAGTKVRQPEKEVNESVSDGETEPVTDEDVFSIAGRMFN